MSVQVKNFIIGVGLFVAVLLGCAGVVGNALLDLPQHNTKDLSTANFAAAAAVSQQDAALTIEAINAVQQELATLDVGGLPVDNVDVVTARQAIAFLPVAQLLMDAQKGGAAGNVETQVEGLVFAQHRWIDLPMGGRWPAMTLWMDASAAQLEELRKSHPEEVQRMEVITAQARVFIEHVKLCGSPTEAPDRWETAMRAKLRENLHDPSTAELLGCGEWQMTANCYERTCRLRAKNAYGAFVVGDVHVTAAKGEVVDIQFE